jgi:hypothetical protein
LDVFYAFDWVTLGMKTTTSVCDADWWMKGREKEKRGKGNAFQETSILIHAFSPLANDILKFDGKLRFDVS